MALSQEYLEWEQKTKQEGFDQAKQEVAFNFLRMGLSVEQVAAGTGLPLEQVQQLQDQLSQESN